jgi:hypothetical protein
VLDANLVHHDIKEMCTMEREIERLLGLIVLAINLIPHVHKERHTKALPMKRKTLCKNHKF